MQGMTAIFFHIQHLLPGVYIASFSLLKYLCNSSATSNNIVIFPKTTFGICRFFLDTKESTKQKPRQPRVFQFFFEKLPDSLKIRECEL